MKAIILNAGIGKRMGNLTNDKPKCLVEITEQKNILYYQLKHLQEANITNIIITTGPFEEKIKHFVHNQFPQLNIDYIKNNLFASTNYIYSLHLAKEKILEHEESILLIHGDLVFEKEILDNLISTSTENTVLLNRSIPLPQKDFKGKVQNGIITEIGVNIFRENSYALAPFYKLSSQTMRLWLEEMERFVQRGETNVYAENAFNNISSKIKLFPLFFDGKFCMEIDNLEDLEKVKKNIDKITN